MEHEHAKLLLTDYLDGALEGADRQKLETHLGTCDQCRQELDMLLSAMQLVRKLPKARAPAHFVGSVRRRARKAGLTYGRRVRRSAHRLLYPFQSTMTLAVLLAAAGALIVMVLLLQGQIEFTVEQPPPTVIQVDGMPQLNQVAGMTWQARGRVFIAGRQVPPNSPLGAAIEVDLEIPAVHWPEFVDGLQQAGLKHTLPARPPGEGAIRLLVRVQPGGGLAR